MQKADVMDKWIEMLGRQARFDDPIKGGEECDGTLYLRYQGNPHYPYSAELVEYSLPGMPVDFLKGLLERDKFSKMKISMSIRYEHRDIVGNTPRVHTTGPRQTTYNEPTIRTMTFGFILKHIGTENMPYWRIPTDFNFDSECRGFLLLKYGGVNEGVRKIARTILASSFSEKFVNMYDKD